jgi:lipopolysaccharide transport system ATP-binding protein
MPKPVIKVENLSKAYQLGQIGTGTISRDLERWWANARGKEDPFLKVGETNDRTQKGGSNVVWSLKDINFEINQGDAVGIIGRNGAGKSTLLKILSRVTAPTQGSIKIKGRVASLLEVGTGFNPELTGKENIFLNGAFLGMRKAEIRKHFDAIVDFAGVERYINTPVKRYSSGMYVRLAFAVAAHLEAEILVVDEVLAVGDAEFQKKCLGKMNEVANNGRTVLFVSHNMDSIFSLTKSTILLNDGLVLFDGNTNEGVRQYLNLSRLSKTMHVNKSNGIHFSQISVAEDIIKVGNGICFEIAITSDREVKNATLGCGIHNVYDQYVSNVLLKNAFNISEGLNKFRINIPELNLVPGDYKGVFAISKNETTDIYDTVVGFPTFTITNNEGDEFLFSKWNPIEWGFHYLSKIDISKV